MYSRLEPRQGLHGLADKWIDVRSQMRGQIEPQDHGPRAAVLLVLDEHRRDAWRGHLPGRKGAQAVDIAGGTAGALRSRSF